MNIGKRNRLKRHSLKSVLFFSFVTAFVFFMAGIFAIVTWTYSASVESTYLKQVISTSEQALSNYSNYMDNVISASDAIQKRLVNEKGETIEKNGGTFFDEVMIVSQSVKSISLYDTDGNLIASDSGNVNNQETAESIKSEEWFRSAMDAPLINAFSRVSSASYFTLSKVMTIDNGNESAILKIVYDFSGIASMIDEVQLGEGGHVYIYDNNYQSVYSSGEVSEEERNLIAENVIGNVQMKSGKNTIFLYLSTIPKTRWRLVIATNINGLNEAKTRLLINSTIFSSIALVAFLFLFYAVSTQISKPIVRLQKEMEAVEDLSFRLKSDASIGGTKEIVSLNKSFCKMMNRIHDLAQKVVDEQKEQNKAELKALQNQINPHFLYNTLDSIIYLIDENESEKAQNMIVALSRFFRISISRGKNIIPVEKELEHVKYYLQIQKMRFGNSFAYEVDAQEDILSLPIIKLILQPIVENAIVHGLGEKPEEGSLIKIKGYKEDSFLCFTIEDNGFGMLPEKVEEIYQTFQDKTIHKGVGLSNVYQRIRIFYGEKSDVRIDSMLDKGTTIEIRIPLEEVRNDEE